MEPIVNRLLKSARLYLRESDEYHRSKVLSIILASGRAIPHIVSQNMTYLIFFVYAHWSHISKKKMLLNHYILGHHVPLHTTCANFLSGADDKFISGKSRCGYMLRPCVISFEMTEKSSQTCIPLFIFTRRYMYIRAPSGQSLNGEESKRSKSNRDQRAVITQNCLLLFVTTLLHVPVLAWEVKD